jgi:hypothetical protein
MTKLLPCPHCGEANELYPAQRRMGDSKPYAIDCLGCGADYTPREGFDVVAMWNRRVPAWSNADALAAALREMVLAFEPFTSKPMGAPYSPARERQARQIEAHATAKALLNDAATLSQQKEAP